MRDITTKYLNPKESRLLEIGAYDRPTFTKERANIFFVDAQSKEEEVDYIVSSNEYEKYISDVFNAILADNVFEHISNPIPWLQSLTSLLEPNGYIFLRVPEYKKTFDKFRQQTAFAHLLTDYIRNVPDIDREHSVEVGIYYDMNYIKERNITEENINFERSIHDYNNPHYGVHCHTFSSDTFEKKIINPILMLGILDLSFVRIYCDKGAFTIVLQKGKRDVSLTFEDFVAE